MESAQRASGVPSDGLTGQNNKLLNILFCKKLRPIDMEWRDSFCPVYMPMTARGFITKYEELFPAGIANDCFIPPKVLSQFAEIYSSLKYYSAVLECRDKSKENLNARFAFMSQLGFNQCRLMQYFDSSHNRYKLFEALHYFIFEAMILKESKAFILRDLNYSNEYVLPVSDNPPSNPGNNGRQHLKDAAEVKILIQNYIFNFTALSPWFDYGDMLGLSKSFVKLSSAYIIPVRAKEKTDYLTLNLFAMVLSVIYNYELLIISIDNNDTYNLAKKELLELSGLPPNKDKINVNTAQDKEAGSRNAIKKLLALIYSLISGDPPGPGKPGKPN